MTDGNQNTDLPDSQRCGWCHGDVLYRRYHDEEWGVPEQSAQELFERLMLEGMQAGLAWITVLRKRESMRQAFFNFDMTLLAEGGEKQVQVWLQDPGVIRHRGKLEAMISNAKLALAEEDFSQLLWQFRPTKDKRHRSPKSVPSETPESQAMSKALKKRGYRFVGPTICYAFMQSVGIVNDHTTSCWRYRPCEDLRADIH